MRAPIIILLLLLFLSGIGQDNEGSSNLICWKKNEKLEWADFQGIPDSSTNDKAICAPELIAQGYWESNLPNFRVTNCFNKDIAWSKDTVSNELLEHEQLHFDIAEVHARRIRKAVDSLREKSIDEINCYTIVIQKLLNCHDKMHDLYDEETYHSTIHSEQKRWESKIKADLEKLEKFH